MTMPFRPKLTGKESQCPLCDRVFSTDANCEKHKPYSKPITEICKNPADIGMEFEIRTDGIAKWGTPMDSETRAKLEKMWAARRKGNNE